MLLSLQKGQAIILSRMVIAASIAQPRLMHTWYHKCRPVLNYYSMVYLKQLQILI